MSHIHISPSNTPSATPITLISTGMPVSSTPTGTPISLTTTGVPVSSTTGTPISLKTTGVPVSSTPTGMPISSIPTGIPMSTGMPMEFTPSGAPISSISTGKPLPFLPTGLPMAPMSHHMPMSSHMPTLSMSSSLTGMPTGILPTQMPTSSMASSMSMVMTFSEWGDYKMQLVFDSWDIQTKTQYFFTWIFIVLAVVGWHGLKYVQSTIIEESIRKGALTYKSNNLDDIEYTTIKNSKLNSERQKFSSSQVLNAESSEQLKRLMMLRLIHSFITATSYGVALLLMLVSMTYNRGLFLALIIGYFLGDLLFFRYNHASFRNYETEDQCH